MKLLFILLAAQTSAVLFTENFDNLWSFKTIGSLSSLICFSAYFVYNILNYKK